jgi:hypothetical protein
MGAWINWCGLRTTWAIEMTWNVMDKDGECSIFEVEGWLLLDTQLACSLILYFPISRTGSNKFLLFLPSLRYFVIAPQID